MPVVSDINADKYQSAGRHQTIRRQTSENSILERKRDNPAAFGGIQNLSPPKGWQRNWIRRGAKRPENPVTCFPVEKRLTTFCASLCSRGPPIGGQENDRVSYLCSAPYTLLPLRGISPQGETRALRDWLSVSYGMMRILVIGSLRSPPPIRLCHWTRLRREGSKDAPRGRKGARLTPRVV